MPPKLDQDSNLAAKWVETQRVLWSPQDDRTIDGSGDSLMTSSEDAEPPLQEATDKDNNDVSAVPPSPPSPKEDKWQDNGLGVVIMVAETSPPPPFASVSLVTVCAMAVTAAICGACTMLTAMTTLIEQFRGFKKTHDVHRIQMSKSICLFAKPRRERVERVSDNWR